MDQSCDLTLAPDAARKLKSIGDNDLQREVEKELNEKFGPEFYIGKVEVDQMILSVKKKKEETPLDDRPSPKWLSILP